MERLVSMGSSPSLKIWEKTVGVSGVGVAMAPMMEGIARRRLAVMECIVRSVSGVLFRLEFKE